MLQATVTGQTAAGAAAGGALPREQAHVAATAAHLAATAAAHADPFGEEDDKEETFAPAPVKMMNFVSKTRKCVSKTRNFAFKMINFAATAGSATAAWRLLQSAGREASESSDANEARRQPERGGSCCAGAGAS